MVRIVYMTVTSKTVLVCSLFFIVILLSFNMICIPYLITIVLLVQLKGLYLFDMNL